MRISGTRGGGGGVETGVEEVPSASLPRLKRHQTLSASRMFATSRPSETLLSSLAGVCIGLPPRLSPAKSCLKFQKRCLFLFFLHLLSLYSGGWVIITVKSTAPMLSIRILCPAVRTGSCERLASGQLARRTSVFLSTLSRHWSISAASRCMCIHDRDSPSRRTSPLAIQTIAHPLPKPTYHRLRAAPPLAHGVDGGDDNVVDDDMTITMPMC